MNVSLSEELERFINSKVSSGRYQSASEVVREGLRLLEQRELEQQAALGELRGKIGAGIDQARKGQLREGDEVFAELRQRVRAKRRKSAR